MQFNFNNGGNGITNGNGNNGNGNGNGGCNCNNGSNANGNGTCTHIIQQGDTLYSLAIRYNTTVTKLLELNPGVEIYNLRIGSRLVICRPEPPVVEPPVIEPPTVNCPDKFKELLMHFVEWFAEQFGDDKARELVESICNHWLSAVR
jgi:hypothetical protein